MFVRRKRFSIAKSYRGVCTAILLGTFVFHLASPSHAQDVENEISLVRPGKPVIQFKIENESPEEIEKAILREHRGPSGAVRPVAFPIGSRAKRLFYRIFPDRSRVRVIDASAVGSPEYLNRYFEAFRASLEEATRLFGPLVQPINDFTRAAGRKGLEAVSLGQSLVRGGIEQAKNDKLGLFIATITTVKGTYQILIAGDAHSTSFGLGVNIIWNALLNYAFVLYPTLYPSMVEQVQKGSDKIKKLEFIETRPLLKQIFAFEPDRIHPFYGPLLAKYMTGVAVGAALGAVTTTLASWDHFSQLISMKTVARIAVLSLIINLHSTAWHSLNKQILESETVSPEDKYSALIIHRARSALTGLAATTTSLLALDPQAITTLVTSAIIGINSYKNYDSTLEFYRVIVPKLLSLAHRQLAIATATPYVSTGQPIRPVDIYEAAEVLLAATWESVAPIPKTAVKNLVQRRRDQSCVLTLSGGSPLQ